MKKPSADDVRKVGMATVAAAHTVYIETVRMYFGNKGLKAIAEANRLHGLELGEEGTKSGGLRKGDLKSIFEFFEAAHPFFGFELEIVDISNQMIELKVTDCPWIATFRAKGAGEDICDYICKMDEGIAQAVDPDLRMTIPNCMMRGDAFCTYRWQK